MPKYRCTRAVPYTNPACAGHKDLSARQGYYVTADTDVDARAAMDREFPGDRDNPLVRAHGMVLFTADEVA